MIKFVGFKVFPIDDDIVELYKPQSESVLLDNKDDIESDTVEYDLQQSNSNEFVENSINYLRSYLKSNEHTTGILHNGLNNIFLQIKIKKPSCHK